MVLPIQHLRQHSRAAHVALCSVLFFIALFAHSESLAAEITLSDLTLLTLHMPLTIPELAYFVPVETPPDSTRQHPIFNPPPLFRGSILPSQYGTKRPALPAGYKITSKIDTAGATFSQRESWNGIETAAPSFLSLDDYLVYRREKERRRIWDSLTASYDLKKALSRSGLSSILGELDGLSIPFPPNPVFGIFGKPEISINVTGDVNVRAGWRWDSQNLGSTSAFGQTQSGPIFSQDINLNVSGKIGDKLKLGVDWNTKQTFELNNKFNIGFSGNDDDIVKRVELGNIQFPVPSTLIGGGQSLFGVRADFQFGPLFLKSVASQRRGERKFVQVRGGGALKQQFQIRAYDYARNHFFLDTVYKRIYTEYFKNSTPVIPNDALQYQIKEIEVWESTGDVTATQATEAIAYADLEPIPIGTRYPDSKKFGTITAGQIARGRFSQLDKSRYDYDKSLGRLTIFNLRNERTYAVSYRIDNRNALSPDDDLLYGTPAANRSPKDTLILKLISVQGLQPSFKTLWSRQMKNIYSIGQSNVSTTDAKINVWYLRPNNDSSDVLPGTSEKVVTVLRVDQVNNNSGEQKPDGLFDITATQITQTQQQQIPISGQQNPPPQASQSSPFFNAVRGEIIFPSVEPFRQGLRDYFTTKGNPQIAEQYVFDAVYDTTIEVARLQTGRDRFIISGEATGNASTTGNRISLGAFNLAPGSVRVTLDGVALRENADYYVEYYTGQVTLTNPRATLPNANLGIEYEQQDLFNLATRTLVGLRADMDILKRRNVQSSIGMTFMLFNQSLVLDRVRLGDEPVSNNMIGFDGSLNLDAPWLTKALDALPFLDTKDKSYLKLKGEIAAMFPTPNKRLSDVASDNESPVAYLDDFEGAQRYISLGLSPSQWSHSSQPVDSSLFTDDSSRIKSYFRGKTNWFQYFLGRTPQECVYPNRSIVQGRSNINDLKVIFNPYERGIYNMNPEFVDKINPAWSQDSVKHVDYINSNKDKIWGGMMRLFSQFNTNFDNENIDFIEIMMNVTGREAGTKMYIDLGQISEDIIPNQTLNTEDGFTAASPIPNNVIDPGEDVGIDTLSDTQEKIVYPFPLNQEEDPARDDYDFDFRKGVTEQQVDDFKKYNNYEGNASKAELGQFPDKEILNTNNGQTIALDNSYFSYEVNLDPNPVTNPQIAGEGGCSNWRLYRIPIRRPQRVVGNPSFSNIQYVRVWYKGGLLTAEIADWRFTGSQWQRSNNLQSNVTPSDSILSIAFVNVEENSNAPDYYTVPPGVQRPRQLNNPDPNQDIRLNEQSLAVTVRNLRYNDERMAVRVLRQTDIFNYKQLKFFIHGDGSMPDNIPAGAVPSAYAFIRFGIDSSNYYEYRRPLLRNWQDLAIPLTELTAIKGIRDPARENERQQFPVSGDPLASYVIRGNPTLTKVMFLGFGIANPSARFPNDLTTTMWVNELRLIDPESSVDWSAIGSAELKLADVGSVIGTFSRSNPNFHRLEERFGNRIQSTNFSVQMQGTLEKFLPSAFKEAKLPISYTHSESYEKPIFEAQSDVYIEDAAKNQYNRAISDGKTPDEAQSIADAVTTRSETLRVQDQWAMSGVKLGIPINYWLIKETFNRVSIGYDYSQTFERSPVVVERFKWQWHLTLAYALNLPPVSLEPLTWSDKVPIIGSYKNWKINFLPSSFTTNLDLKRGRTTEQSRFLEFPSPVVRDFTAQRTAQFSWKLAENGLLSPVVDYSFTTASTLAPLEVDEFGRQRTGNELSKMMILGNGKLLHLGDDGSHVQNFTINFRPRLPDIWGLNTYLDNTGSYIAKYEWRDPLQPDPALRDAVKYGTVQSNLTLSSRLQLRLMSDKWYGVTYGKTDTTSSFFGTVGKVFKTIFLDFDEIKLTFKQDNISRNPGLFGGNGLTNQWRGIFGLGQDNIWGPSAAYQLGLVGSPHGSFSLRGSSKFPFFGFNAEKGIRPPNSVLPENFNQASTIEFRTSRQLWEGANLDLTWKSQFGYNQNQTVITDSEGVQSFSNVTIIQTYSRTYLSLPKFLFLAPLNNSIEHVIDLYLSKQPGILAQAGNDTVKRNQLITNALSESFHDGLESFAFLPAAVRKIMPSVNWSFRWDGIEKWGVFGGVARRIALEHNYTSTYQENARITDNGRFVDGQQVQLGFQPLIGLTMSFDETKLKGTLTGTVRYNTKTSYSLLSATSNISRESSSELSIQGTYSRRGFKFALLGIDLENDLEFAFLGSYKRNQRANYDILKLTDPNGQRIDGTTNITIEPSARYSMSNRVTARLFFRYEGTINEGASTPGFSTTQVGLDIRISISGGR
ncbi:MAG: cell surface protein SprA [Candidatus Kapaibacterium sp.]